MSTRLQGRFWATCNQVTAASRWLITTMKHRITWKTSQFLKKAISKTTLAPLHQAWSTNPSQWFSIRTLSIRTLLIAKTGKAQWSWWDRARASTDSRWHPINWREATAKCRLKTWTTWKTMRVLRLALFLARIPEESLQLCACSSSETRMTKCTPITEEIICSKVTSLSRILKKLAQHSGASMTTKTMARVETLPAKPLSNKQTRGISEKTANVNYCRNRQLSRQTDNLSRRTDC